MKLVWAEGVFLLQQRSVNGTGGAGLKAARAKSQIILKILGKRAAIYDTMPVTSGIAAVMFGFDAKHSRSQAVVLQRFSASATLKSRLSPAACSPTVADSRSFCDFLKNNKSEGVFLYDLS